MGQLNISSVFLPVALQLRQLQLHFKRGRKFSAVEQSRAAQGALAL
jgi:hypothetical protein